MKWQTKSNQFSIFKLKEEKSRMVDAFLVDVDKKSIAPIKIENHIEYIKNKLDIYQWEMIKINKEMDCIIFGIDSDLKRKKMFSMKCINQKYHGNALVVRTPQNGYPDKLKNTKISLEYLKSIIEFF